MTLLAGMCIGKVYERLQPKNKATHRKVLTPVWTEPSHSWQSLLCVWDSASDLVYEWFPSHSWLRIHFFRWHFSPLMWTGVQDVLRSGTNVSLLSTSQVLPRQFQVCFTYTTPVPPVICLSLDGQCLRHVRYPRYLGVTLDRTLSFREHLT